jgi:hypothetical protein
LASLGQIKDTMTSFNIKFTNIEMCMRVLEAGDLPPLPLPLSPKPIPTADKGKAQATPAIPLLKPAVPAMPVEDFPALAPASKPSFANAA